MHGSLFVSVLLAAIVASAIVAKRLALPYPIVFVFGGIATAFVPHAPRIELDPQWVFLIFLPPLLFSAGWQTDWPAFKANLRPIGLLAIGLVCFTTGAVAVVVHALAPALGWPVAFVVGAVVSPPDAVAAGAVFERFAVPRRILTILDGEGLVNDATALVIFQFAVAAALTGAFSPARAGVAFVLVAAGGVAIGLVLGRGLVGVMLLLHRYALSDSLIDGAFSLLAPYVVYIAADTAGASGVLATVTAAIVMSRRSTQMFDAESRLVTGSVWNLLVFLLNGVVFLFIGLELRTIVERGEAVLPLLLLGAAVSLAVIVVRLVWVFPASYVPRRLFASVRAHEPPPDPRHIVIIGWSGMRGIVSLASALAVPAALGAGVSGAVVVVTVCVIVTTLVGQGLALIPLIGLMRLDVRDARELARREREVRVAALLAGIARLRRLEPFDTVSAWEIEGRIVADYEYRIAHLRGHLDGAITRADVAEDHELQAAALDAEAAEILRLRDRGLIPDEIYRRVRHDLDLAQQRLV